jgi:DNA-binding transcriptional LysR family regulator
LGVSASAIGKSVARLEDRLGVRLFHRSTRSVTLTAEGMLFLERSRRILAEIEAAELELSQASSAPRGPLGVSLPLVSSLVLPVLGEFMREYPEIELDLDFTDRLVEVIEEGFDAVVARVSPRTLASRRAGWGFRSLLVASPDYLARRGTPRVPADLMQHIACTTAFPTAASWSHGRCEPCPRTRVAAAHLNDLQQHRDARVLCAAGLGIAYLPEFSIVNHWPMAGCAAPYRPYGTQWRFLCAWPASKYPSPKVRALVDFLCARVFPVA